MKIEELFLRNGTIAYRLAFLDKKALQILVPKIRICGSFYLKAKQNKTKHFKSWSFNEFLAGAPNVNFRRISVRKTIWGLEFSEHLW